MIVFVTCLFKVVEPVYRFHMEFCCNLINILILICLWVLNFDKGWSLLLCLSTESAIYNLLIAINKLNWTHIFYMLDKWRILTVDVLVFGIQSAER